MKAQIIIEKKCVQMKFEIEIIKKTSERKSGIQEEMVKLRTEDKKEGFPSNG